MALRYEDAVCLDVDELEKRMKKKKTNMRKLSEDIGHNRTYIWGIVNRNGGLIHKEDYRQICDVLGANSDELKHDIRMIDFKELKFKISELEACRGTYKDAIVDVLEIIDETV